MDFENAVKYFQELRKEFSTLAVSAISWLYCTNTRDPVQQRLLQQKRAVSLWLLPLRIGWLLLIGGQWFFVILFLRLRFQEERKNIQKISFDGIGKTWLYPKYKDECGRDFYFGNLQHLLEKQRFSLLLLCGNPVVRNWLCFVAKIKKEKEQPRLPDLCLISPFYIFQMIFWQIKTSLCLLRVFLTEKDFSKRLILRQAVVDVLRQQTLLNGLHFWIGQQAILLWRPKVFLTLYEGFAWEKCLWRGVRSMDPDCRVVGYQHTVILNRAMELREPSVLKEELPDIILCLGHKTLQMIQPEHKKQGIQLIPFGSFRFTSDQISLRKPKPFSRRVLVLPDGTLSEALLLFNVSLKVAKRLKDHSFVFRLHPLLSPQAVAPFLEEELSLMPNVAFSTAKGIEEDFASCSALLYRASSASLYGILKGLKPFYWREEGEENIDPLFELETFREEVTSVDDFVAKLDRYRKMNSETIFPAWKVAAKYIQEYTVPVDEESIQNFMEAIQ